MTRDRRRPDEPPDDSGWTHWSDVGRDPRYDDAPRYGAPGYGDAPRYGAPGYGDAPRYGAPGYGDAPRYGAPGYGDAPRYGAPGYGDPRYRTGPPHGHGHSRRPAPPTRPERRRRGGAGIGVILTRSLSALVTFALVAGIGVAWWVVGGSPHNSTDATKQAGSVGVASHAATDPVGAPVTTTPPGTNILIVGTDARTDAEGHPLSAAELQAVHAQYTGGARTDTIMLMHVPSGDAKATIVSIPRDTWIGADLVDAPGMAGPTADGGMTTYAPNKINAFYSIAQAYEREYQVSQGITDDADLHRKAAEAGRTMLIKVVQQFTGLKVDHYVEVNLIGFYLLSQAIGGVPVCLKQATSDWRSGANFPAGHFTVSGSDALSFVRQRHGLPRGDLDRIRRQQMFLASAANQLLSVGTLTSPSKLSALIDAAHRSLVMDSDFNLLDFAQQVSGITSGGINFATMPTDGTEPGVGTWAFHTDRDEIRAFFAGLMTPPTPEGSATTSSTTVPSVDRSQVVVNVQNGTVTAGLAGAFGQAVAAAGFERGQIANYPGTSAEHQQSSTTVHYPAGGEAAARAVIGVIGGGTAVADDDVPAGHVLVVVGADRPTPPSAPAMPSTSRTTATTTTPALPADAINAGNLGCIN